MLTKRMLISGGSAAVLWACLAPAADTPTLEELFGVDRLSDFRERFPESGLIGGRRFAVSDGFRKEFASFVLDPRPMVIELADKHKLSADVQVAFLFEDYGRIPRWSITNLYLDERRATGERWSAIGLKLKVSPPVTRGA